MRAGTVVLQVGDVLSKCSAVVLKAGKVSNSAVQITQGPSGLTQMCGRDLGSVTPPEVACPCSSVVQHVGSQC